MVETATGRASIAVTAHKSTKKGGRRQGILTGKLRHSASMLSRLRSISAVNVRTADEYPIRASAAQAA